MNILIMHINEAKVCADLFVCAFKLHKVLWIMLVYYLSGVAEPYFKAPTIKKARIFQQKKGILEAFEAMKRAERESKI